MQAVINLNTVDTVSTLENPTTDKTIVVWNVVMKVSNSTTPATGATLKYSDGDKISLAEPVAGDKIWVSSDTSSYLPLKNGQDIIVRGNDELAYPLSADVTVIINYELI